jgi:hypothetical protein
MNKMLIAAGFLAALAGPIHARDTPSAPDAEVFFVGLEDGATVTSPLTLHFGLSGMGVAPAGVEFDNTGHHHLLINAAAYGPDTLDIFDDGIPGDETHRHFGGGQTTATIELPPGTHTLQLVLGDLYHIPHADPVYSEQITVTVE